VTSWFTWADLAFPRYRGPVRSLPSAGRVPRRPALRDTLGPGRRGACLTFRQPKLFRPGYRTALGTVPNTRPSATQYGFVKRCDLKKATRLSAKRNKLQSYLVQQIWLIGIDPRYPSFRCR